jgi:hypothetical protein
MELGIDPLRDGGTMTTTEAGRKLDADHAVGPFLSEEDQVVLHMENTIS